MKGLLRFGLIAVTACIASLLTACSSTPNSPTALNLAGTWTATATSTQGHGKGSGSATVTQAGTGVGVNGTTTLSTPLGHIAITQTGTAFTGTISTVQANTTYSFTGTLSGGNFTVTGSVPCTTTSVRALSIAGTITSNAVQGTYTFTSGSGCYYPSDAGTFTGTKS